MFASSSAPSRATAVRGRPVPTYAKTFKPAAHVKGRQGTLHVAAMIREWPDPEFIEEVRASFPEKAIADVEEARVLFSECGYTYLDVRPTLELDETGKVKGSVNIPYYTAKWVYDPEARKKNMVKEPNPDFINLVKKKFPSLDAKIMVGCSNGSAYSGDALGDLDDAGYTNLVGIKGGFYAWFNVFDNKLGRRRNGEYQENYSHNGDSCGIHSSGAGFEKMDPKEAWVPRF